MTLAGGSGGGATIPPTSTAPSGPAGGSLAGTYPNPAIAALVVTDANVAAANKDGAAGTPSLRTLGTTATTAAAGNDARLSNARTPTAHAVSHEAGGTDAVPGVDTIVPGANVTVDNTDPRNPIVGAAGGSADAFPLADPTDVVIDTTTYNNTVTGSGKLTAVVGAPGTGSVPILAWAFDGDAFPRALVLNNPQDAVLYLSDGTYDPYSQNHYLGFSAGRWNIQPAVDVSDFRIMGSAPANSDVPLIFAAGAGVATTVSAMSSVNLVSGAGQLISADTDMHVAIPITYTPTAVLTATCAVALSFDAGGSYTTLYTVALPALAGLAGLVVPVVVDVPVGALLRLTVTNAAIGAGSAYP